MTLAAVLKKPAIIRQSLNMWQEHFWGRYPSILSLLVKDSKGELLAFHQEVKRFQKERICWHSTNQCCRVYFDSHTWQESLSVILTLKRFLRVYRLQWFIKLLFLNWRKESFKFFVNLNGRTYNATIIFIVSSVNPASILKMNFWYTLTCTLPQRPIGGYVTTLNKPATAVLKTIDLTLQSPQRS